MRLLFSILILILVGCSTPKDKILVPELHAGFYVEALDRINDELKSDPDNEKLVDQKLFYCEQLEWPTTCISALDSYKKIYGMTNQLVEQYIAYYTKHERYRLLGETIEKWDAEFDLKSRFTKTYIDCLTRLGRISEAKHELRILLSKNQSLEDTEFASFQYIRLRDTAMAAYNLGKLYKFDKQNDLMWEYGKVLIELGYQDLGLRVLDDYVKRNQESIVIQFSYAQLLRKSQRMTAARSSLRRLAEYDTAKYLLSEWYKEDLMWDSSAYFLRSILNEDSTNRKPLWKLGELYEDRGWLSTALGYFQNVLESNPSDSLAQQKVDLIQRKIAYLQRLKFEESKIPVIELEPIKIEN